MFSHADRPNAPETHAPKARTTMDAALMPSAAVLSQRITFYGQATEILQAYRERRQRTRQPDTEPAGPLPVPGVDWAASDDPIAGSSAEAACVGQCVGELTRVTEASSSGSGPTARPLSSTGPFRMSRATGTCPGRRFHD